SLSHKTYTDPHEALEVTLCVEAIGSVGTIVSPFLEAQITTMEKQLENLYTNIGHEAQSGIWCTDCEFEGHIKDIHPCKSIHVMSLDCEVCHFDHDVQNCPLLKRVIIKNVSMYYKIYHDHTHDTSDYRLIDHIQEVIEIGECQTSVASRSKEHEG
ncbi:hypothetical protein KI387_044593, partial [Taxus chinensis]